MSDAEREDPRVDILAERLATKPWADTAPGWQDAYRQEARELLRRLDEVRGGAS